MYQYTFKHRSRCSRAKCTCRTIKKITERGSKRSLYSPCIQHSQIPSYPALPDGACLKHKMAKWQNDFPKTVKTTDSLFLVGVQSLFLLPSLNRQNSAQHTKPLKIAMPSLSVVTSHSHVNFLVPRVGDHCYSSPLAEVCIPRTAATHAHFLVINKGAGQFYLSFNTR